MTQAVAIFLAGVAMASSGQILMKKGALRSGSRPLLRSFLDPFTIAGYALMLCSTVMSTIALKTLPLHLTVVLLPVGYIVVVVLSVAILHERMRRHHVWGMLLILLGIAIFNAGRL
ncbi:MAG: small multidrug resistance pump [Thermoanaerobaculia bacterium]|nr:small multidrug resistance pump [Thermoanaerobaculia bacterium]